MSEITDRQYLELLEAYAQGATGVALGARIGKSRSAALGLIHRAEIGVCERHDGTLPRRWWEAGLRKQEAVARTLARKRT